MLNIGLIGCGRISKNHFNVFREMDDRFRLVSVCDIVEEKARAAGEENNVPFYTDIDTMLNNEKIEVISVCTPSGLHPEHGIAAARRGIHVITEKPMAIDLISADRLIDECEKNGVQLFVVKQNRLNPGISMLKKAMNKGRFGDIYMANATIFWQRPQEYYDLAQWRGTWKLDGGAFMNQASHYVDLLVWLLGDVDYVFADTATMARNIEAEDTGAAIIRFKNGAIGVIQVTMLTFPRNMEGSITILGNKGTVKIGGTAVNNIDKWEFENYDDDDRDIETLNYQPANVYGFGHLDYYKNVADALRNNSKPLTDGYSGRKALELILGIYRSAETGEKVYFPLEGSSK